MTSQKTKRAENFPVGSLLIPRHLRADVHAYYGFARLADDIADSPALSPDEKKSRLRAMKDALEENHRVLGEYSEEQNAAQRLGAHLTQRGLGLTLATDLLEAFLWDADNNPCRTWADLINYCQYSACPVGRFLMAIHGETAGETESDALCSALQILNHVQDASDDWAALQRVYIPKDWMSTAGVSTSGLSESRSSKELRAVLNRVLDNTDRLINTAAALPRLIQTRGLAAEATICVSLAKRLSHRLRQSDPIEESVSLSGLDWGLAGGRGLLRLLRP
ncbi:MAG: squalene/phytoene synthase family protein [Rhodospirillaceae bacterium]|nr:squalene/phytoene synthase family protein [Rhodospirillaceae bacterium]